MDTSEAIRTRRSVRRFRPDRVPADLIDRLLDAARWAPSGLNNQPWRFVVVEDAGVREQLAGCTKYGRILRAAPLAVAVFLNTETSYHREKDIQGVGAALQNLLLEAHNLGLGACWLGEILNQRERVEEILGVPAHLELMAVVAVGYPEGDRHGNPERLPVEDLVVARF
ncbi:nitroreductase family protein [Deferrisoma palaeochoriense]